MAKDDKAKPQASPRVERLASALRKNLKRRKAQARGRASSGSNETGRDDAASPPSANSEPQRGDR